MGRSWQTLNFEINKICQQYVGPCFSYNPHYFFYLFFCEANSKAHKVEQVFPYAACNNHSFVVLFEADVAVWKSSIVRVDA